MLIVALIRAVSACGLHISKKKKKKKKKINKGMWEVVVAFDSTGADSDPHLVSALHGSFNSFSERQHVRPNSPVEEEKPTNEYEIIKSRTVLITNV